MTQTMTVAIVDDEPDMRESISQWLALSGFRTESFASAEEALKIIGPDWPGVVITDIRMPPTHSNEGIEAAKRIRSEFPQVGVVVLSQYVEEDYAFELLADGVAGMGYLLKERVSDLDELVRALHEVARGGSVLDPLVVEALLARRAGDEPLLGLTDREREVLELIAEGRSNKGIAERLGVSTGVVQKHVGSLFAKLGIPDSDDDHRRILAVLTFLRSLGASRLG